LIWFLGARLENGLDATIDSGWRYD